MPVQEMQQKTSEDAKKESVSPEPLVVLNTAGASNALEEIVWQSLADHGWPCPTFRRPWLAMANAWPTMAGHGWPCLMFGRPLAGWP